MSLSMELTQLVWDSNLFIIFSLILFLTHQLISHHSHHQRGSHSHSHSEPEKRFHSAPMMFYHSTLLRSFHFPPYSPLAYYKFTDFLLVNPTDCRWITLIHIFSSCSPPYISLSLRGIIHVAVFAFLILISCIKLSLFSTLTGLLLPMLMRISFSHQILVCHRCILKLGFW